MNLAQQSWDWGFTGEIVPDMLRGLEITVRLVVFGYPISMVLGLVFAVLRRSRNRLVSRTTGWFVEFVRSTPIIVQLFVLFFVMPRFGVVISAGWIGVLGLGVHYATYTSEVYRAGIEGVPSGQWEAANALNFSTRRTWTQVVLPQAVPTVIPPLGNYLIALFKDTPYVVAIGVTELLGSAQTICSTQFRCVEPYSVVGLLFLAVSYPSALLVRFLESRYAAERAEE